MPAVVFLVKTSMTRTTWVLVAFLYCAFCFSWHLILENLTSAVFTDFKIFVMFSWGWHMDYVTGGLERHLTPGTNQTSTATGKNGGKNNILKRNIFSWHHCHFRSYISTSHLTAWAQACSWALFPKGNWSTPLPWGVCSLQPKDELSACCSSLEQVNPNGNWNSVQGTAWTTLTAIPQHFTTADLGSSHLTTQLQFYR